MNEYDITALVVLHVGTDLDSKVASGDTSHRRKASWTKLKYPNHTIY